jgi:predicted O-methyltransferase YrrM
MNKPAASPLADEYLFTTDWFTKNIPVWLKLLAHFRGRANLRFLEVGSFEGRSAVWLLENVLTHESSHLICIDTFEGSVENPEHERVNMLENFKHNIRNFGRKVDYFVGESRNVLRDLPFKDHFDFMYIDGDHKASSVLEDAILAFRMLKPGGLLVFDDYTWRLMPRDVDRPKLAIDTFTYIFADELDVVYTGPQVAVVKHLHKRLSQSD